MPGNLFAGINPHFKDPCFPAAVCRHWADPDGISCRFANKELLKPLSMGLGRHMLHNLTVQKDPLYILLKAQEAARIFVWTAHPGL